MAYKRFGEFPNLPDFKFEIPDELPKQLHNPKLPVLWSVIERIKNRKTLSLKGKFSKGKFSIRRVSRKTIQITRAVKNVEI